MADAVTRTIKIVPRQPGFIKRTLAHVSLWGILIGAVGLSRVWFGGAFVIDLIVGIFALTYAVTIGQKFSGQNVNMTPEELRDYVADGCPEKAKTWSEGRRLARLAGFA